jgi:aryl-alcohol dehydrogenase-like predicted oxidoreductase
LGFGASGAWALRWFSEGKAEAVLRAGLEGGIAAIDTGPSYAGGNAEPRLGRLLERLETEGVVGGAAPLLSSKVGTQLGEGGRLVKAFGPDAVERQLEASLRALRRDALDVLYLHGPDEHAISSTLPTLVKNRQHGKIGAIGVCCDGAGVAEAAARPEIDWIMAPFNLLAQGNGPSLRAAKAAGKKVAIVAPLAQGLWRRDLLLPRGPAGLWYAARALLKDRHRLAEARKAAWLREVPGWSPAALCIAFVRVALRPDLILTTTTTPRHLTETLEAARRDVPLGLAARLQGLIVS